MSYWTNILNRSLIKTLDILRIDQRGLWITITITSSIIIGMYLFRSQDSAIDKIYEAALFIVVLLALFPFIYVYSFFVSVKELHSEMERKLDELAALDGNLSDKRFIDLRNVSGNVEIDLSLGNNFVCTVIEKTVLSMPLKNLREGVFRLYLYWGEDDASFDVDQQNIMDVYWDPGVDTAHDKGELKVYERIALKSNKNFSVFGRLTYYSGNVSKYHNEPSVIGNWWTNRDQGSTCFSYRIEGEVNLIRAFRFRVAGRAEFEESADVEQVATIRVWPHDQDQNFIETKILVKHMSDFETEWTDKRKLLIMSTWMSIYNNVIQQIFHISISVGGKDMSWKISVLKIELQEITLKPWSKFRYINSIV